MKGYAVSIGPKAQDWFDDCLDGKLKRRIGAAIDTLGHNPRPPGCVKLTGEENVGGCG